MFLGNDQGFLYEKIILNGRQTILKASLLATLITCPCNVPLQRSVACVLDHDPAFSATLRAS